MNQTQRKHVLKRLNGIRHDRVSAFEDKLYKQLDIGRPAPLTAAALIQGIIDGSIKLDKLVKPKQHVNTYDSLEEVFDLGVYDEDFIPDDLSKKVDDFAKKLKLEAERIEDQLILGDAGDALEMIAAFEKFDA